MRENQSSHQFKSLLLAQAFEVAGQPSETKLEVNPNMPLVVPAGQDQLTKIGEPEGAQQRARASMAQLWQEQVEATFEKTPDQQNVNL